MQDNPARKKPGYAGRVYKSRQCEDCPAIFQPKSSAQKRCEDCQYEQTLKLAREGQQRKRRADYVARFCLDCGTELPPPRGRGRLPVRCEVCTPIYRKAHDQGRNKARTESGERKKYDARYRTANNEQVRASNRKYKAANPEVDAAAVARRRQRMEVRMDEVDRLLSREYRLAIRHDPCLYCGSPENHEVDHFFPLSKGGTDHWWNLVAACRKCNRGSGGKHEMCGTAYMLRLGTLGSGQAQAA